MVEDVTSETRSTRWSLPLVAGGLLALCIFGPIPKDATPWFWLGSGGLFLSSTIPASFKPRWWSSESIDRHADAQRYWITIIFGVTLIGGVICMLSAR